MDNNKTISFILPFFNEEKNLPILFQRIQEATESLSYYFKFIFIDDGSSDKSAEFILPKIRKKENIMLIQLSRNFGHQTAVYAGLQHAESDAVIIMDTDLQDSITAITDFIKYWEEGYQVVYAVRQNRKEGMIKRIMFSSFYRLFRYLANVPIPIQAGLFCLIDKKVVDLLANMSERNRYIPGLRAWTGFNQIGIPVDREERGDKKPRASLIKLFRLALDAIISFSWTPLKISTFIGIFAACLAIIGTCIVLYKKYISLVAIPGWTSILLSIFFFGAVQLIAIGIIGEYLGRIYEEVKQRPPFIIDRIVDISNISNTSDGNLNSF